MKIFSLVIILIIFSQFAYAQCTFCGKYLGKNQNRSQTLEIKSDSTFIYEYRDSWGALMAGTTIGKWSIKNEKITLNSKYDLKDYSVEEKWIDYCRENERFKFLDTSCSDVVIIEIKNLEDAYIWHLRNVMINDDTSKIGVISYAYLKDFSSEQTLCVIPSKNLFKITVYNGFYIIFEHEIGKEKCNYIEIKGNFSDSLWYTYIKDQTWRIKRKKLTGNKVLGKFLKKK